MNKIDNFWYKKRVLITGVTGFKGSWLAINLLKKGADVFGYSLENEDSESLFNSLNLNSRKLNASFGLFENYYANINDIELLNNKIRDVKPDFIFHLAAQSLVIKGYENPLETWETNLMGSIKLLDATRNISHKCVVIVVTTDKVYENKEKNIAFSENSRLGGIDPYSASKAALEIAVDSWRKSFCDQSKNKKISLATVRAGNVIGGGDWSTYRLVPDCVKSLLNKKEIILRNPYSTRPWQHVLEPLSGYLKLAEKLFLSKSLGENEHLKYLESAFNFGPDINSNKTVLELVEEILKKWKGKYSIIKESKNLHHEAKLLFLASNKAKKFLGWQNKWDFEETIQKTINWYQKFYSGQDALECCIEDIKSFEDKCKKN
tara:strand:+ start:3535 stop:4662 length:1128 start_codon:yes stop_codon:yes gene_type:complete